MSAGPKSLVDSRAALDKVREIDTFVRGPLEALWIMVQNETMWVLFALFLSVPLFRPFQALADSVCPAHEGVSFSQVLKSSLDPDCKDLAEKLVSSHRQGRESCLILSGVVPREHPSKAEDCEPGQTPRADREIRVASHDIEDHLKSQAALDLVQTIKSYDEFLEVPFQRKFLSCFGQESDRLKIRDYIERMKGLRVELLGFREKAEELAKKDREEKRPFWTRVNDWLDRNSEPPLKNLDPSIRILASAAIGAISWRVRGGFLNLGTTTKARYIGALLPFLGIGYLNAGIDGAIAGALMIPPLHFGWADYMDMGRVEGSQFGDFSGFLARGLIQSSLSGGYLMARGYGPEMFLSGAGMPICYWGSWNFMPKSWENQGKFMGTYLLDGPTSLGELCSGGVFGGALAYTLSAGKQ